MMLTINEAIDCALCDCHEGLSSSKIEMSELVGMHLRNDPHYRLFSTEELLGFGTKRSAKPPFSLRRRRWHDLGHTDELPRSRGSP